jgi:hypothetical protein
VTETTDPSERDALGWILAGYGDGRWPGMLDARCGRLFRLGVWWKHSGASPPTFVDEINSQVLMINNRVLVIDDYGDVVMTVEVGADDQSSIPPPMPVSERGPCSKNS